MKKYDEENGTRLTDCCGAYSTFMDVDLYDKHNGKVPRIGKRKVNRKWL